MHNYNATLVHWHHTLGCQCSSFGTYAVHKVVPVKQTKHYWRTDGQMEFFNLIVGLAIRNPPKNIKIWPKIVKFYKNSTSSNNRPLSLITLVFLYNKYQFIPQCHIGRIHVGSKVEINFHILQEDISSCTNSCKKFIKSETGSSWNHLRRGPRTIYLNHLIMEVPGTLTFVIILLL